ncbi:tRNA:m(4)X modification enzyme HuTRM13 [Hanseniaspora uvarum DSM 2768]|nr:tRNA:m(4)X modification enzyme HuTRM13 [Hanseniaspora uvarum DSM 2768]
MEEPVNKKLKTDICEFVNPKNNKQCKSLKSSQSPIYCTNHILYFKKLEGRKKHNDFSKVDSVLGKRIPCPLDKNHSCWEKELEKHMQKCTKGKMLKMNDEQKWFKKDINVGTEKEVKEVDESKILKTINVLKSLKFDELETKILKDENIEINRVQSLIGGQLKHAVQQSSLISHMRNIINEDEINIVEFGCGRAELSRYACLSLRNDKKIKKSILIDRGNNRMKFDKDIKLENDKIILERFKCDIKDMDLSLMLNDNNNTLAISKHLCGSATDLTLRCMSKIPNKKATVIAMCCRHACNSRDYINPEYIKNIIDESKEDIVYEDFFKCLTKISSYATSSYKESEKNKNDHFTGMNVDERTEIGLIARRTIDEGRLQWCKKEWSIESSMLKYCDYEITLENVALVVPF